MDKRRTISALVAAMLSGWGTQAQAELTRLIVESREMLPHGGGPVYEILRGRFEGELAPAGGMHAPITDLLLAPRNRRGRVEYSATFAIAKPVDMAQASAGLVYEVPNRGRGQVAADPDGHVRVISGWQGDIVPGPDRQTAQVPVARNANGSPLVGPALARFVDMAPGTTTLPIVAGLDRQTPRPAPVALDGAGAKLYRQARGAQQLEALAGTEWAFADCSQVPFPGTPDGSKLCLRNGFDPGYAYTLVYQARDPLVLGMGFAATRDLNAFLRYGRRDRDGNPNPLAGAIRWTVATGNSQSGNFLRSFVHLGFNAAGRRRVFDGINPDIAGRHVPLNMRFGVPGGASDEYDAGSEGALWWARYDDRVRGRGVSSLLDRCNATATCPKVMETFGSAEFWNLRMSPGLVGTAADADIALPANVRRYYFPSVTHGGSRYGGFTTAPEPVYPQQPRCTMQNNPNPSSDTLRALRKALIDWVATGKLPPDSRYPTLKAGELVAPTAKALGWPAIPKAPAPDGKLNPFVDYDFGAGFRLVDVSGVAATQPPQVRRVMPSLVPRVDADGNESSGIPSVQLLVPLGTYTGWNERADGYYRGKACGLAGGFIPFAATQAQRLANADPRPSLEERYGSHEGFVARVRRAAADQVSSGFLLPEDAGRILRQAEESDVLRH